MSTLSKKQIRRLLGQRYIHDMPPFPPRTNKQTGITPASTPVAVFDLYHADLGYSGQNLYQNSWFYIEGSTAVPDISPTMYQYMVASYNFGSGAFLSQAYAQEYHGTESVFELHTRISPLDKDNAIDDTVQRLRLRQEVAIPTIDGALFYTLDGCASPFVLDKILNVHLFANPSGSLDRDLRAISDWEVVTTATGNELRTQQAVQASQQIILDAILIPSLSNEQATITIPDERWILAGAAARCYDLMIQAAPAQQVALLTQRRAEWAQEFSRLSARFQPTYDRAIKMHDTVRGKGTKGFDQGWW